MLSCQMRQILFRFAWVLAAVSPVTAGFDAGLKRQPGLAGLREALRADWPRCSQDDVVETNEMPDKDGIAKQDPLRCFEVHRPVLTPEGPVVDERPLVQGSPMENEGNQGASPSCDIVLMTHSFGNSYGDPFVAQYHPPDCAFNRVVLRLDVVSEGRQFDRLAVMYLGDIEVWRTSTAEPKPKPGIVWTIRQDFTSYLSLWNQPQTLIFDLGNLINDKYTGSFNATLTATFFKSDLLGPNGVSADTILPISARRSSEGRGSAFIYPETPAETVLTLPSNINRGMMTISATGQAGEEFWWSNVPEKDKDIFDLEAGALPGLSSYREVQVRIDDKLAGFVLPFPVVFTGGIAPPLHRPLVGIQTFDLREHEIDISPFLGVLCDGNEHTFALDVYGVDDSNGTAVLALVPMHWVMSAKLFLWLDDEGAQTIGKAPHVTISELDFTSESSMAEGTVLIRQRAKRSMEAIATVATQQGEKVRSWRQVLSMGSEDLLSDEGDTQHVNSRYDLTGSSSIDGKVSFSTNASYPINSVSTYKEPDGDYDFTIRATLLAEMGLNLSGQHVFPLGLEPFINGTEETWTTSTIETYRQGSAFFYAMNGGNSSGGSGTAQQAYSLTAERPLYRRYVSIQNETKVSDLEFVRGQLQSLDSVDDQSGSLPARQSKLGKFPTWLNRAHANQDILV